MKANIILSLISVSFLVSFSLSASSFDPTAAYTGQYPICSATGTQYNIDYGTPSVGGVTAYDRISYAYDSTIKDNVEIRAIDNNPGAAGSISLISVGRDLAGTIKTITKGLATQAIYALYGKLLITSNVDANDNFKAYYFDATTIATGFTINIPTAIKAAAPYTSVKIKILSFTTASPAGLRLYLEGADGKGVYHYPITLPGFTTGAQTIPVTVGSLSTFPSSASFIGTDALMVNKDDGTCHISNGVAFVACSVANIGGASGWTYVGYPLISSVTVIAAYHQTSAGNVASAIGTTAGVIKALASPFVYRSFTDYVRNVIVVGSAVGSTLNWLTYSQPAGPAAAALTQFYAPSTANHALFLSAVSIAFANHRAFLLQASQVSIVELGTTTDITLIKKVSAITQLASLTTQTEVTLTSNCLVVSVSRHTCFATTLNCIVTVKSMVDTKVPETPTIV